jgi:hypothetical protein
MLKLTELEPRWFVAQQGGHPIGISFDCPCCRRVRLAVAIHLDGTALDPEPDTLQVFPAGERIWTLAGGASFNDVSLTPSVDASSSGHWHGFITGGEIR